MNKSLATQYIRSGLKLLGLCVLIVFAIVGAEDVLRFLATSNTEAETLYPSHLDSQSTSEYDPTGVGEIE